MRAYALSMVVVGILSSASSALAASSISSASNQSFPVAGITTAVATITVVDDGVAPVITAAGDLRIRIPAGFNMTWDTADTTATIGGAASSRVSTSTSYEDSDHTLVVDVTADFGPGDSLTISGLSFSNFSAPSAADNLELVVDGSGVTVAHDDKAIQVVGAVPMLPLGFVAAWVAILLGGGIWRLRNA